MVGFSKLLKNIPELQLDESKRKILLLYILALLFVFVLYSIVFLKPSLSKIFELIPKVRVLKSEINAVHDDSRFEDKLTKKLSSLQDQMVFYENKLSRKKELPKLLESLSKLARSSRVKIRSITPIGKTSSQGAGTQSKKSVYQEVPIAITAQCGYHDLGTFINKLENDERYLRISNLKMKANASNPKRHNVEFVVYAYTLKNN